MQYDSVNGRIQAQKWGVPASTLARWRRQGVIPDCRALREPLDRAGRQTEEKLVRLLEEGWLKARPLSRLIGSTNKLNALLAARRYPDDNRYCVYHLDGKEIRQIRTLLDDLQRSVGVLLYIVSLTPDGQNYNEVIQADLRALLRRECLNGVNVRAGVDERQEGRFWAFIRGRSANRKDLDAILLRLKAFLVLLS